MDWLVGLRTGFQSPNLYFIKFQVTFNSEKNLYTLESFYLHILPMLAQFILIESKFKFQKRRTYFSNQFNYS